MMKKIKEICIVFILIISANAKDITLNDAIKIGLENNQEQKISQMALQIAHTQYLQSKSLLYPSLDININATRYDEDSTYNLKGDLTLPPTLGGQNIPLDINAKLLGRDSVRKSIDLNYVVYSGGKIDSIINQAKLNKKIAEKKVVRKKQDVILDIKKYFYSYILADQLYKNAKDTYERMEAVKDLTEQLYKGDSLKVKKTDYLRVQIVTSLLKTTMQKLDSNRVLAKSAIANSIGLKWEEEIKIKYDNKNELKKLSNINNLIQKSFASNIDIQNIDIANEIYNQKINEAKSNFYPKVIFHASAQKFDNSYSYGLNTKENENSWLIGAAIKIPLFNGFRDKNNLTEAKLKKKQNLEYKILLQEVVAMQIKQKFTEYENSYNQLQVLKETKQIAYDNTELNMQGYQIDLISTNDVIQAQLMQSYTNADYSRSLHTYRLKLAEIDNLIGTEIEKISQTLYKK